MKILSTKRFEELLQEINNLEKEVHLERRAKNKNQALLNDSLKKIKELENYLEFHEKKLKTLKTKHHTVNSKLGGYVTSCNNLRDQLKNVQEQYKQVKIENTRLRKLLDKKQDALSVKDAKIIWDQQIIELYKKKLNDYEQRLDNYKEEFKKCHVQKTINEYDKRLKKIFKKGG